MFKELLPLLAERSLVLTAGVTKDDVIRLTITPRPRDKDEAKAVTQPFIVEGTAEELDKDLPAAIAGYTGTILDLSQSLVKLKAETDAALKEAKAESDKRIAEAKNKNKPNTKSGKTTEKPAPAKAAEPPSLFDATPATAAADEPTATEPVAEISSTEEEDEDDDTDEEEEEILKEAFDGAEDQHIAA